MEWREDRAASFSEELDVEESILLQGTGQSTVMSLRVTQSRQAGP